MNKAFLSFVIVAAIVVAFAACRKTESRDQYARVMFVHGCTADTPATYLDAKASTVVVNGGGNMPPLANTGYRNVLAGGGIHLAFFLAGAYDILEDVKDLMGNTNYTAFIGGSKNAPKFVFTLDTLTVPTAGNVKIRFANMSPDTFKVMPTAGGIGYAVDVTSEVVTPFIEIAAGTYNLAAFNPSTLSNIVDLPAQPLEAGKIYTVMMAGTKALPDPGAITLTLITNN